MASTMTMFQGAKWRFLANFVQKAISFGCNQILLQNTTPEILGIANIQFELFLSTILFLSREGIRMAILRTATCHSKAEFQKMVNISWFPFLIVSTVIAGILTIIINSLRLGSNSNHGSDEGLGSRVAIIGCFGVLFESMGEPWFNLYQYQLQFKPRAQAEMVAVLIQNITTVILVVYFHWGVSGFATAQLVYGLTYFAVLSSFSNVVRRHSDGNDSTHTIPCQWSDFLPSSTLIDTSKQINRSPNETEMKVTRKSRKKSTFCESETLELINVQVSLVSRIERFLSLSTLYSSVIITASSVLKHVLTQSDRIVLTFFYSSYQQGVFAFANNYGSLVARLVFMPLEDSSRVSISNTVIEMKKLFQESIHLWTAPGQVNLASTSGGDTSVSLRQSSNKVISTSNKKRKSSGKVQVDLTPTAGTPQKSAPESITLDNYSLVKDKFKVLWNDLYSSVRLLNMIAVFGFIVLLFGPFYVRVAVNLFVSRRWRTEDVISTLCTYCVYIVILGINGISEAFLHATCSESEFVIINICYVISTVVYVCVVSTLSVYVPGSGASGLVLASAASMAVRILYAMWYIRSVFFSKREARLLRLFESVGIPGQSEGPKMVRELLSSIDQTDPLSDLIPSFLTISVSIGIASVLYTSSNLYATSAQTLIYTAQHIALGGASFLVFLGYLFMTAPHSVKSQVTSFVLRRLRRTK